MAEQYEYVLDCEPQPEGIQHILSADVERVLSLATRLDMAEAPEVATAARALADRMKPLVTGTRVIEYTELATRTRRVLVRGGNEAEAYATLANRYMQAPANAANGFDIVDVDVDVAAEVVEVTSWHRM